MLCTLDRGPLIEATLRSLLDQQLPRGRFEIVVVDNGSNAANAAILTRLAGEHAPTVRCVREEQRGLSHARNRGVREARAPLIVFVDDDGMVTPTWLSTYVDAFARDPGVGVLGGAVELVHLVPPPPWCEPWLLPYLGAWDHGSAPCDVSVLDCPRGGNLAVRRVAFERAGGFSPRLGRRPGSLLSLEEQDFCQRAAAAGFRLGYVPGAPLRHHIDADRWADGWFARRLYWQGRSLALFDRANFGRRRLLARLPGQLRRAVLRRGLRAQVPRGYVAGALRLLLGGDAGT